MRKSLLVLLLSLGVMVVFTTPIRGVSPTGSVTIIGVRTMQVCINDLDDPSGTPQTAELWIDNWLYDRFKVPDAGCVTRGYAPFGPSTHPVHVYAIDAAGQPRTLISPTANLVETCADFGAGTKLDGYCGHVSGQAYYPARQANTKPLISDLVWAGVDTAGGGAIRQLYSLNRSYNLLDEHPGGSMQLSLWGGASGAPLPPSASNFCNGWQGPATDTLMNTIQTQGPGCTWGKPVGYLDLGYTLGITTYLPDPENHLRQWTLQNPAAPNEHFPIWTAYYNRGDHLEANYRFINGTAWDFGLSDQEIPTFHFNAGLSTFYWGKGGFAVGGPSLPDTQIRLTTPAVGPPYGNEPHIQETWNSSWVSACDPLGRCVTVAPHDPPTAAGIHVANIWAGKMFNGFETNLVSLIGRYPLPGLPSGPVDKSIKVYVFPYKYSDGPPGGTVRDRLLQLRGWL